MRDRSGSSRGPISLSVNRSGCLPFSHFTFGTLQPLSEDSEDQYYGLSVVSVVHPYGHHLPADGGTSPEDLKIALDLFPSFMKVDDTKRSLSDDRNGYQYTVLFAESMGNVPSMVAGMSPALQGVNGFSSHVTVTDGNFIGGYFLIGTSKLLSSDASAEEVEVALELLIGMGDVAVSRSGPDYQGGYTWTITWLSVEGDVPTLTVSNSLTGSAATVSVRTVQDGNYLGGYYTLEYAGKVTSELSFDADASNVQEALTAIPEVGLVEVSRSSVDTEGGSNYLVTFKALHGDIPMVTANSALTGENAVVKILEVTKGSEAVGTALKISYAAPFHCSESQVLVGSCGAPVDNFYVEAGTNKIAATSSVVIPASYQIQRIRTAAPSLMSKRNNFGKVASGFFKLSYNGVFTSSISGAATAADLRHAIEKLPDVNTVLVSRTWSATEESVCVVATPGATSLTCCENTNCEFSSIPPGELIRIDSSWYRVMDSYDGNSETLPLATAEDSSVYVTFAGPEVAGGSSLFRWVHGYEWTVTILSVSVSNNQMPLPFGSSLHGLNPDDSTVSVRSDDCSACASFTGLKAFTDYYVRGRSHNDLGYSDFTDFVTGTTAEIPGAPSSLSLNVVSGSEMYAVFTAPVGADIAGIDAYTVHWDTDPTFVNALSGDASCASTGFGSCQVFGDALNTVPPYKYLIRYLDDNTRYYVRVAARNHVDPQQTDPTGAIPDNTMWSQTATAVTANQVPSPVLGVTALVASKDSVQLIIQPSVTSGGLDFLDIYVEWDTSNSFTSSYYGSASTNYSELTFLTSLPDSSIVYLVDNLDTGSTYWFRVSMRNAKGAGVATLSTTAVTPAGKADAPRSVELSHAVVQSTDITDVTVTWAAPSGHSDVDGGSPITGYLVEWWEMRPVHEKQLVRFTSSTYPPVNGDFRLIFGPTPELAFMTQAMHYTTDVANVRAELINLGVENANSDYVIGDISVSRNRIPNAGYEWIVEFLDESQNPGDQVPLLGDGFGDDSVETVEVIELVTGQRTGGADEVQIISILAIDTTSASDLSGWFRLSFNGNEVFTPYLPVNCSAELMIEALEQLSTLRQIFVSKEEVVTPGATSSAGYEYRVTFLDDVGNQPSIYVDQTYLATVVTDVLVTVYDGDNSIDSTTGYKLSTAFPGEAPAGYMSQTFGADVRSMTIPNLVPGTEYFVSVAAINSYGVGEVQKPISLSAIPPKQIPQPPTEVSVDTNFGSSSTLAVTFAPPLSDGGAEVLKYRVELDNVAEFTSAIYNDIMCSTNNQHTIWEVKTTSLITSDPVVSGSFALKLEVNGNEYTTDLMPYDAAALQSDEIGVLEELNAFVTTATHLSSTVSTSSSPRDYVFKGDRLKFDGQKFADYEYTVVSVDSSGFELDYILDFEDGDVNPRTVTIYRLTGGRNTPSNSRVFCVEDDTLCPPSRVEMSGSMQSKLEYLTDAITEGVNVIRYGPDIVGGYTWMVTFKDDSPANPNDFYLSVVDGHSLATEGSQAGTITTRLVTDGESYDDCSTIASTHVVPTDKALTLGEYYFARVMAFNEIGYSLPQRAPAAQKPMVVPGRPTSVVLKTMSKCDIKVSFNPPDSDGGDTIDEYMIEYSTDPLFNENVEKEYVTYLGGGAPFFKVLTGLEQGTFYYVRVSAHNSQGYGEPATSTPGSLQPYEAPSAPTNVMLAITSNSMLTVSFNIPFSDGGDEVVSYRVEWDTQPGFNSNDPKPHKDFIDLDASTYNSYTIRYLETRQYYVRVFAINAAGPGAPALANPRALAPALVTPGRPHTIAAETGDFSKEIKLTWLRPRIPAHGIPCGGTPEVPLDCPSPVGGGLPSSTGGTPITEYQIEYNDRADFTGQDGATRTTTDVKYTLTDLTPGRVYYIRVLARNAMGAGPFCKYSDVNCNTVEYQVSATAAV